MLSVVGHRHVQLSIVVEVADHQRADISAGPGSDNGGPKDAFALIEQHTDAAVIVLDDDVGFAIPVEVSQRDVVRLLRGSSGVIHWLFEFARAQPS